MIDVEVTETARKKAKSLNIETKLDKQIRFLASNPRHPSLRFKKYVAFKENEIWKFEIDLNWWALTIKPAKNKVRVYNIIHHPPSK